MEFRERVARLYERCVGYDPVADDPEISTAEIVQTVRDVLREMKADGMTGREMRRTCPRPAIWFPIRDADHWAEFVADNRDAIDAIPGGERQAHALAANCSLIIGGGAAPQFRVGFEF